MTSRTPGITISNLEVSNISKHGLWLIHSDQEYFLPYEQFPWFQEAPVKHIFNVEEPHPGHLYWPDLDVDLYPRNYSTSRTLSAPIQVLTPSLCPSNDCLLKSGYQ
jgi:hypothetical protein